jgi:hypothetical protein
MRLRRSAAMPSHRNLIGGCIGKLPLWREPRRASVLPETQLRYSILPIMCNHKCKAMSQKPSQEDLGEPALKVAGFQLWIHGRQFPEATDWDDGNWLLVTAHCSSKGASVWISGPFLMVMDILYFSGECNRLLNDETSTAGLEPLEPELSLRIEKTDNHGHLKAQVTISPDLLTQSHTMEFMIDQSFLPSIIDQCASIAREYPVRGKRP